MPLLRRRRGERARGAHLHVLVDGIKIETIRPGRRTHFDEAAREIFQCPQRLDHRAAGRDNIRQIANPFAAVGESHPKPMPVERPTVAMTPRSAMRLLSNDHDWRNLGFPAASANLEADRLGIVRCCADFTPIADVGGVRGRASVMRPGCPAVNSAGLDGLSPASLLPRHRQS
jgi:hypothetical protein